MFAIVAREFGGPEVLTLAEQSDPRPGPGEIRVRVHAAGVNPYDTYMRAGGYAITPELPYTPGADAAGVIDELGDGVTGVRAGDRVYIGGTVKNRAYGAYASMVLCHPHQVHPLPERLSFAQGAAINVPYATAWRALFQKAQAVKGESILVHGASGAVGVAVTQMAHAAGLMVIGTASTDEGAALVRAQGADHVVNHRDPGYLEQVTALTGGGPNVIIEMLANQNLDHDLAILAKYGRIVIIGNRGRVEIDPRRIMGKEAAVMGMVFWNLTGDDLALVHAEMGKGFADGTLTPAVSRELPLAEAAQAHRLVMEPGARGKIVLIP